MREHRKMTLKRIGIGILCMVFVLSMLAPLVAFAEEKTESGSQVSKRELAYIQIRGWKVLTSAKTSGTPGITNSKILMAYEGTDKSWTFIPVMTRWCTVESIDPKSSGISLTVNPTYDSSNIQVSLLAIKFSQ